jgi:hypothetical protein
LESYRKPKAYEWTVDSGGTGQTKEEWNLGGLGIAGDSGAGVIDMGTNSLYAQAWGTQDILPRIAYITAWGDIVDDTEEKHEEKYGQKLRPTLPQPSVTWISQLGEPFCLGYAPKRKTYLKNIGDRLR